MNNWDKLSDLDINLKVAKFQYPTASVEKYIPKPTILNIDTKVETSSVEVGFDCLRYVVNFCEDWRYAGQLIDESKISLINDGDEWEAEITYMANVGAHQTAEECSYFHTDKNPKRAAAIVYLISKGIKV